MQYLVTGAAGFIGFHVAQKLLQQGHDVLGVDVVNDYYDPRLKESRLEILDNLASSVAGTWTFLRGDLAVKAVVDDVFQRQRPDRVIHLAAQAGVRHSLDHPLEYVQSNIVAFTHLLEACRYNETPHFVYASTSSVYGANAKVPFSEQDPVDHPLQFYAATKRANELMAHSYSQLFALPTTGLRFFTVYGPWGRPDMAPILFADAITGEQPIKLFNNGNHSRDFTYIDDIVDGILLAAHAIPVAQPDLPEASLGPATSRAPFRIFNIGNSQPAALITFVETLERMLGKTTSKVLLPLQPGDVVDTYADISRLSSATGYQPKISLDEGVTRFARWYLDYYG
jgi:UDP-glucuronate 4-epimerase